MHTTAIIHRHGTPLPTGSVRARAEVIVSIDDERGMARIVQDRRYASDPNRWQPTAVVLLRLAR